MGWEISFAVFVLDFTGGVKWNRVWYESIYSRSGREAACGPSMLHKAQRTVKVYSAFTLRCITLHYS